VSEELAFSLPHMVMPKGPSSTAEQRHVCSYYMWNEQHEQAEVSSTTKRIMRCNENVMQP
jgi:hypothetical protein